VAVSTSTSILALTSIGPSVQTYGYLAVFLAIGLEALGAPVPGETTLIAAALYAGTTHRLSLGYLVLVACAAAIVGDNFGYLIGRFGGYRLLRRYGHYVRITESKLKVGRYLFDRHGGRVVFIGRFISVLRTYVAFLAGTSLMNWRRFLIYNAAGGILWATGVSVGAYYLGAVARQVGTVATIASAVLVALVIVTSILYVRRQMKGLEERAEQAYPGPLEDTKMASRTG
jgi:membrane protein DedA with SNARE-associated domain